MTTKVKPGMVEDGFATTAALAALRSLFVGTYQDFAYEPNPTTEPWWLPCYGQLVLVADYPMLFAKLGTTYGGNGTTTFGIPDHRGRTRAGKDNMGGTSANRLTNQAGGLNGDVLGATGGSEIHQLTVDQLAAHAHSGTTTTDGEHTHGERGSGTPGSDTTAQFSASLSAAADQPSTQTMPAGDHEHGLEIDNAGGNQPHNNVQPTIIGFVCILAY